MAEEKKKLTQWQKMTPEQRARKTASEAKNRRAYIAKNIKIIPLSLNKKTDRDILEWLGSLPNKNGYLKALVRADMELHDDDGIEATKRLNAAEDD